MGKDLCKKKLERKIASYGLEEKVVLKGYIDQKELCNILPHYDFFIRLSTQEGFGISFIEAMACGVIPIGTPVGGIVDIIKDGASGYLVDLSANVSQKLADIIKHPEHWAEVRKEARQKAESVFDWQKVLPKVEKLYE